MSTIVRRDIAYGRFHPGQIMTLKNVTIFFYGETNISLKVNIYSKQPLGMYQLRLSRGAHDLF